MKKSEMVWKLVRLAVLPLCVALISGCAPPPLNSNLPPKQQSSVSSEGSPEGGLEETPLPA